MENKRGGEYYFIIISMILGIVVVGLIMFFLFHEYFTRDDVDWEVCRQSVLLRGTLPEVQKAQIVFSSFKDDFPLKCKTNVVYIDDKTKNAEKVIKETIESCWNLFGEGKYQIFPSDGYGFESFCVPCARIHFDSSVKNKFMGENMIDMEKIHKEIWPTYYPVYKDSFYVDTSSQGFLSWLGTYISKTNVNSKLVFPKYVDSSKGDIIYYFGQLTSSAGGFNSYVFYFQQGQNPDPYLELEKIFAVGGDGSARVCDQFDGVPA